MTEISSITAVLQARQEVAQSERSVMMIKQAAQAEQALADMLAENAKQAQAAQERSAQGGVSIYV